MATGPTYLERLVVLQTSVETAIREERARLAEADRDGRPVTRLRRSKHTPPACGTEAGYQRHRHTPGPACDACRMAHAMHERARSQRAREAS